MRGPPSSSADFYGRGAIDTPQLVYRALLDAGPLVWLPRHKVLCAARYEPLRSLLQNDSDFISGAGVTMNPLLNRMAEGRDTVIVADGDQHTRLRRVLIDPMRPRALESLLPIIEKEAHERVSALVGLGPFEAMDALASHLPTTIVANLVGLPPKSQSRMVAWSKAVFNSQGPFNLRTLRALPSVIQMFLSQNRLRAEDVVPDTWIHRLFELRNAGEIKHSEVIGMVLDYVAPSLDTTIFAMGHLFNRLGRHREQWHAIQEDPTLIPAAVNESLRIDTVIRAFTRVAARDTELAGFEVPAGQRVLAAYGAANRDERQYPDPDRFDVTRNARDHMAFGHGRHACVGTRLAKVEMEAMLRALIDQCAHIKVGEPKNSNNNTLHGFDQLPLELVAKST